jgi:hypothetical protein
MADSDRNEWLGYSKWHADSHSRAYFKRSRFKSASEALLA